MLSLAKPVAETVARHLVATGALIDDDPNLALEHALAARRLAARIAAVREAVGLAAYRAGEWQTAIAELRTYHRMSGRQTHLAVLADCERALGRPERAIDLYRGADRESLDQSGAVELLIVAAGARADMGQGDAAVAMLQVRELTATPAEPWTARLRYAYADALLGVERREEAREWFARAAEVDEFGETDAAERLLELDGVVLEGDEDEDEDDDVTDDGESDRVADADADADAEAEDSDDASARRDRDPEDDDEDRDDEDEDDDEDRDDEDDDTYDGDDEDDEDARPDDVKVEADVDAKAGAVEVAGPEDERAAVETAAAESRTAEAAVGEADLGTRPVHSAES
ncbi:Replicase polyprotein 1ab [Plantactinospora mayteni]|uniref:Replicase polyprotein 1ab n=1 Tax=Plantactinospora mayteni TaxID=566021 RepID=UPI001EF4F38F|nr:Replicase polyprotein 1ab [Plantactinospora mayteni]